MRLKIASRSSDLARIQAFQVARALKAADPNLDIEFEFRASLGDRNLDVPLSSWESKGVFTQDFFDDLKAGLFDMVVHSWKDLPTENRPGTAIAATLERADVRDLLLVPKTALNRAGPLEILSSSPRRSYNLQILSELLPGGDRTIEFKNVRGNVPTRIGKMFAENRGLILAKAALDRLVNAPEPEFQTVQKTLKESLQQCRFMVIPLSIDPPAAAQGALAIEIADGRKDLIALLNKINDQAAFTCVTEERDILKGYGGGCHQKIGVAVLPKPYGRWKLLRGETHAGEILNRNELLSEEASLPKATSRAQIFPLQPSDNGWFARAPVNAAEKLAADALWVARAEAWPENLKFEGVVWASGLATWKKLAAQGVWVNGCAEGLGDEDPRLKAIAGELKWLKLTHAEAPEKSDMPSLATYRLAPKDPVHSPDLNGKTHFFWMSGTSFHRAKELFPHEIENGYHGCGPGLTFEYLRAQNLRHPAKRFLNLDAFLSEVLPS